MGYPMTTERVLNRNSQVLEPFPVLRDDIRRLGEDTRRESLRLARDAARDELLRHGINPASVEHAIDRLLEDPKVIRLSADGETVEP